MKGLITSPSGGGVSIMHALSLLTMNQHTKCEVPSFTGSKYMIRAEYLKNDHVTLTMSKRG